MLSSKTERICSFLAGSRNGEWRRYCARVKCASDVARKRKRAPAARLLESGAAPAAAPTRRRRRGKRPSSAAERRARANERLPPVRRATGGGGGGWGRPRRQAGPARQADTAVTASDAGRRLGPEMLLAQRTSHSVRSSRGVACCSRDGSHKLKQLLYSFGSPPWSPPSPGTPAPSPSPSSPSSPSSSSSASPPPAR